MSDPILRRAERSDVTEVLELWTIAAENADRPKDSLSTIEALIDRDPEALIVAEVSDQIVGSVIAGFDGWRSHLYRLAVHPGHRRRGIARALLNHAEVRLLALGARRIDAMVLDQNELGQSIWDAAGYRRQPQWSRWIKAVDQPSW